MVRAQPGNHVQRVHPHRDLDAHAAGRDLRGGRVFPAAVPAAFDLAELPEKTIEIHGGAARSPLHGIRVSDMGIAIKRVYDPGGDDGTRILVDRLWPRGVSREHLQGVWVKEIAPSAELRKWFDHQPEKWPEFKRRYFAELDGRPDVVNMIVALVQQGPVTLLYASKNKEFNHAVALREYLENVPHE